MGILRTAGRAAIASSVHGRVQRRQQQRWANQHATRAQQPVVHHAPPAPAPQAPPVPQTPAVSIDEQLAQLTQLGQLRDAGILTEDEFAAKKAQILAL
ncbi:SHOCT domain-containing protein [Gordonia sp. TBRC 11910]|uniref:SHOCT domain-containing protein n=1 Tax=Gordonia asplenii TaxID=2725283 RepID=A0A848L1L0_9ACTN|nr:SHOCT domain-containing protein [Gordonia asplenii]NMO02493.1 SHOCT domain-containing protein [Gordonia asplenii]